QDAPSTSASSSTSDRHLPIQHQEIPEDTPIIHDVHHHQGMIRQRNPTKFTTLQIISEDGPKIILWTTSLAILLVLYQPENS
ncbi:hypothetical protein Tco_0384537, partial [Tanacetum coccineum]